MTAIPNRKKRLLFVDDETMLLDLYKLVFEDESDQWEISFAPGGQEALALMDVTPMDVLVSDMRMPGMSGAELVQEVMKRYPRTSRLIMSGYADSEQIAQCLGATHQFIAKPFELQILRGTISRVCSLDSWLLDERLKSLVAQLRSLPSLPSLYFQIMEALGSPDTSLEQIGDIIGRDPSMTAKILQLVNSAFFGIARRISNPVEAVQFLGVGRVRSLVLSLHVFSCFDQVHLKNFSIETVWKHSMSTGLVAQKIARLQKADRAFTDEAYVAGMLHDIGKVMLAASLPDLYDQAVKLGADQKIALVEAEREIFGVTHAQVGAYLLGLWGLPITIVEAVAFHHNPLESAVKTFSPLTTVHVASALERQIRGLEANAADLAIDTEYLSELDLEARLEDWREAAEEALGDEA
ncbi:MAG: response regulator [Chthoniobacteraceae bacterium]